MRRKLNRFCVRVKIYSFSLIEVAPPPPRRLSTKKDDDDDDKDDKLFSFKVFINFFSYPSGTCAVDGV